MRYAIYFVPGPESPLHHLGSTWLGRDAYSGRRLQQPSHVREDLTADAARYGFHATLKPPFRLKPAVSPVALASTVQTLAHQHESFSAGPLQLKVLDGFLALVLAEVSLALNDLASDCVQRLDDFRAPPGEAELRKRRLAGLTAEQDALLQRWGYPYVLDQFRFHMTLTSLLSDEEIREVMPRAEEHFASVLGHSILVDALSIMLEAEEGADFLVHERIPLIYNALKAA
jgi:putative phosphonate metabolism protein